MNPSLRYHQPVLILVNSYFSCLLVSVAFDFCLNHSSGLLALAMFWLLFDLFFLFGWFFSVLKNLHIGGKKVKKDMTLKCLNSCFYFIYVDNKT